MENLENNDTERMPEEVPEEEAVTTAVSEEAVQEAANEEINEISEDILAETAPVDVLIEEVPAPTKEELKAQRKAARKEKRRQLAGVSFIWAAILLLLTNIGWMGYIKYYLVPKHDAQYIQIIEEKDDAIRRIQIVYDAREKDFEKRLTEAEEKYEALNERLERAIEKYNKYFGKDDPVE